MVNVSKIRGLIKEHGWSASYLCRAFGKNPAWLADMERGRGIPDENTIKAIANKLDTTIDYLTDKTDKKNKPAAERNELINKILTVCDGLPEDKQTELLEYAKYLVAKDK